MKNKKLLKITLVMLFLLAGLVILHIRKLSVLNKSYNQITKGMSRKTVIEIMGSDYLERNNYDVMFWNDKRLSHEIIEQVETTIAYSWWSIYLPISFRFSFDKNNKVIAKQRYD